MSGNLSRTLQLAVLAALVILTGLACSLEGIIVTLTPEVERDIIPTMTTTPTVVYPTLTPYLSPTPTALPDMVCDAQPVKIVCKATVCVVRNEPKSGKDNIAYTIPNQSVLEGAVVCIAPNAASLERDWFYLGKSGDEQFWAINMNQVWEIYNGE